VLEQGCNSVTLHCANNVFAEADSGNERRPIKWVGKVSVLMAM